MHPEKSRSLKSSVTGLMTGVSSQIASASKAVQRLLRAREKTGFCIYLRVSQTTLCTQADLDLVT